MVHLLRRKDECHVSLKKIRFHKKACIDILVIGIPAGIQNAIFAIAKATITFIARSFFFANLVPFIMYVPHIFRSTKFPLRVNTRHVIYV